MGERCVNLKLSPDQATSLIAVLLDRVDRLELEASTMEGSLKETREAIRELNIELVKLTPSPPASTQESTGDDRRELGLAGTPSGRAFARIEREKREKEAAMAFNDGSHAAWLDGVLQAFSKAGPGIVVRYEPGLAEAKTAAEVPDPGSVWRHYKGGLYFVMAIEVHSETMETMVAYAKHYEDEVHVDPESHDSTIWVRPLSMWHDVVAIEIDGHVQRRFEKVTEAVLA